MIAGKVSQSDMEAYNNDSLKTYNDKALDACPNCGRTFLPDRLVVHLRSCNKTHGKESPPETSPNKSGFSGKGGSLGGGGRGSNSMNSSSTMSSPSKSFAKPKSIVCYIWYSIYQ
jgi:hypothetical protein